MTRSLQISTIIWRGFEIEIRYEADWLGCVREDRICHFDIKMVEPEPTRLPISETGYLSYFANPVEVDAAGGPGGEKDRKSNRLCRGYSTVRGRGQGSIQAPSDHWRVIGTPKSAGREVFAVVLLGGAGRKEASFVRAATAGPAAPRRTAIQGRPLIALVLRMLVQVHDELVFEVEPAVVELACARIRAAMVEAAELRAPLEVEIAVGANWDEAH